MQITITAVKQVARITVGFGATSIANQIIRNNVAPGSLFQKITITAATVALGGLLGERLGEYSDEKIDAIAEIVNVNTVKTP